MAFGGEYGTMERIASRRKDSFMDLETFAELQRLRVRRVDSDRRKRLEIRDADAMETRDAWPVLDRRTLIAAQDPIRAAYRKLRISYE